jgi:FdhD protein
MTLTWVICGAGRRVGKTHLAERLCEVLPNAVYAKKGCGTKTPGKPANFFHSDDELEAFVEACCGVYDHVVVESNRMAHEGRADAIIFVDGIPGETDYRDDVDLLRSRSHLHVTPSAVVADWQKTLRDKLGAGELCDAVCEVLAEHRRHPSRLTPATRHDEPLRISVADGSAVRDPCEVVVEQLVTIMVEGVGNFAVMCTPCDVEALAVGFVFSEGLISSIDDVVDTTYRPDQQTIGLRLEEPGQGGPTRNLIVTSSCGLCGSRNVDRLLAGETTCADTLRVSPTVLQAVSAEMHGRQQLFSRTGGTHAAGIFDADGKLLAMAEDLGRHNALDKAIGKCLLRRKPLTGCGAMLSGRVSLEMVAKALRAKLEVMAAVSAPSSLAIDVAERCNITLCGFVRGQRATVYTHPRRIVGLKQQS